MKIGIPKERWPGETRVGLIPSGMGLLVQEGHVCSVERGAGEASGFGDDAYVAQGARMVDDGATLYREADLVLKVIRPTTEELQWLRPHQIVAAFINLAATDREYVSHLLKLPVTTIAYESIKESPGLRPILRPMSELAGRLAPQLAGTLLQSDHGGRGVLLSSVPGVPPADVAILGAGVLGTSAARAFLNTGAQVIVLDRNMEKLRYIDQLFDGRVTTMVSYPFNIARVAQFVDVLVGAVLDIDRRTPILLDREVIRSMKPGAVFLDFSIDQGGCSETSRLTSFQCPTYFEGEVLHYCVPNVPALVPRTASRAFYNAAWPYIRMLVERDLEGALELLPSLSEGIVTREGMVVSRRLAGLAAVAV